MSSVEPIRDYLRRSGSEQAPNPDQWVENEHGFLNYRIEGDRLIVFDLYGPVRYWFRYLEELARAEGINRVTWVTYRDAAAWQRLTGAEVVGYVMECTWTTERPPWV